MAKKSKQPLKTKKEKRAATRRQERRFVSQTATSPMIVRSLGALAATLEALRRLRRRVLERNRAGAPGAESRGQEDSDEDSRRHASKYIAPVTRSGA